jgi:hypothetical protein
LEFADGSTKNISAIGFERGPNLFGAGEFGGNTNGGLHPDLLNTHARDGETLYTIDQFYEANLGKTLGEIMNQRSPQRVFGVPLASGGPQIRYITDPYNPSSGAVIDLRHLIIIGSYRPSFGSAVEWGQSVFGQKSAYDQQDYFSNNLGYEFSRRYGQLINQNPANVAGYLREYLSNRSKSHYNYK